MVFYFSGTDNSRFAAERIASVIGQEAIDVTTYTNKKERPVFTEDGAYVFVSPSYMSAPARTLTEFIEAATFPKGAPSYFVVTCASSMGVSPRVGQELCEKKGIKFMGAAQVIMPQNYIALFPTDDKSVNSRILIAALPVISDIAETIRLGEQLECRSVGAVEYACTKLIRDLYYDHLMKTKKFRATDACVSCNMCAKVCPLNNITMKDGRPSWGSDCTHCMGCINKCPKDAIEYGKSSVGKVRYKGPKADMMRLPAAIRDEIGDYIADYYEEEKILCATVAPGLDDAVAASSESFMESVFAHADKKGISDADVQKRANIDRKAFSKLKCGTTKNPSKSTAMAIAIALELNLADTEDLLARAGYALSPCSKQDLIVRYFIEKKIYDINEINTALYEYGEQLLGNRAS